MAGAGVFLVVALGLAGSAAGDELRDALVRCAQLQDAQLRLACYDALAAGDVVTAGDASALEGADKPAPGSDHAPDPDALVGGSAAQDGSDKVDEAAAAAPEANPLSAERLFGLTGGQNNGDYMIESRVVGEIRNPRQGTRFTLENGQVWQQVERTRRNYRATNPKVEIKEGFMNSYRMRLEGLNGRIRVRRVK